MQIAIKIDADGGISTSVVEGHTEIDGIGDIVNRICARSMATPVVEMIARVREYGGTRRLEWTYAGTETQWLLDLWGYRHELT